MGIIGLAVRLEAPRFPEVGHGFLFHVDQEGIVGNGLTAEIVMMCRFRPASRIQCQKIVFVDDKTQIVILLVDKLGAAEPESGISVTGAPAGPHGQKTEACIIEIGQSRGSPRFDQCRIKAGT